ncbi:MAG: RNA polymerase sigma factor [Pirellulaceae bacterium]
MDESSAALGKQVQQNDPVAFAKLVGQHYSLVFNRCLRMLGHRQDAEDVTQETFSRALRYLHRWDSKRPLEPWLITIAGNRCRTHLSRQSNLVSLSADPAQSEELAATKIAVRRANQLQAAETLREEVALAIEQLPRNHRLAFEMFHQQGLSYEQISQRLGCPIGTAKTWVHRARGNLMSWLSQRDVMPATRPLTESTSHPPSTTTAESSDACIEMGASS